MANWLWGLGLTVFTIALHTTGAACIGLTETALYARIENKGGRRHHGFRYWVIIGAVQGLFFAVLHGAEAILWALAYWQLRALDSFSDALFFSMDSMGTLGNSGITLKSGWRMMGAMESMNGMLLFGISTAFMFAMMQIRWRKLIASNP